MFDSLKKTFSDTSSFLNVKAFLRKITDEKYLENMAIKKLELEFNE